jgi:ADP-ribose pyrophosphatase YjhB (NUDIX family)
VTRRPGAARSDGETADHTVDRERLLAAAAVPGTPEELNRETVERRLDRLRADYDPPVTVVEETVPSERFDRLLSAAADGHTGSAYAWTVRQPVSAPALSESMPPEAGPNDEHVLLVLDRAAAAPLWGLPGGGREDGETYEAAARREVREETGVEVTIEAPFRVIRVRTTTPQSGVTAHTLWTFFDATYEAGRLDPQASELRGVAWFVRPPGELGADAARRAADFWPAYDPLGKGVVFGPADDDAVEIDVIESPEGA